MRASKMNQYWDYRIPFLHKILRNFDVGEKVQVVVGFGMASRIMVKVEEIVCDH
jgi:hypothetical protein